MKRTANNFGNVSPDHAAHLHDIRLLLDTLNEQTGIDFRGYALSSLQRRIAHFVAASGSRDIAGLHLRVKIDGQCLTELVNSLTVHTTAMFRDPKFFLLLRTLVVPFLRTYPFIRVWVAGCSTGEEAYSIAILLHEEGLSDRCRIYATDVSDAILKRAQSGIFPLIAMQDYSRNYQQSGGAGSFSDYYSAGADSVIVRPSLKDNIVFGTHNLVSDASFNEFQLVLCRNVMIYFGRELQERVHDLLYKSLIPLGYLGLGRSETVRFTSLRESYTELGERGLFRRIK